MTVSASPDCVQGVAFSNQDGFSVPSVCPTPADNVQTFCRTDRSSSTSDKPQSQSL
jgi:hypothetical protein